MAGAEFRVRTKKKIARIDVTKEVERAAKELGAKSGALGLTQLLPGTAKPLVKSVLRVRYRRAFLYDPGVNARLGAAFFRQLLDRFGGNARYALAGYNGGPARMQRVLAENHGRSEDEILESHPLWETRDYVRRVLLYAESYRELYPPPPAP